MEILNRKARFNYFIIDEMEAGIELKGTEIKSIRNGKCSIEDTYARIKNGEVYLINMYIAKYEEGNIFNHDERRERRLLLHKSEIIKLSKKLEQDSYTLIPLKIYMKKNNAKVLLGLFNFSLAVSTLSFRAFLNFLIAVFIDCLTSLFNT